VDRREVLTSLSLCSVFTPLGWSQRVGDRYALPVSRQHKQEARHATTFLSKSGRKGGSCRRYTDFSCQPGSRPDPRVAALGIISSDDILASVPAMTTVLRVALIATLFATRCLAQTGAVTFYTPGNSAKGVAASLLPRSQQPFTGWLFDGPQRLVHVRPGRFMKPHT
jgi:hypothetical protein